MLLFWSLLFLSAFFHKTSSNVSRNMLKTQTESHFHLTMSKWPISTAKLSDKEIFTVFGTLSVTWRQREEILSPPPPPKTEHVLSLFWQVCTFHSVRYVRRCTASTVVPKYGPHLVQTPTAHMFGAGLSLITQTHMIDYAFTVYVRMRPVPADLFLLSLYPREMLLLQLIFSLLSRVILSSKIPSFPPDESNGVS